MENQELQKKVQDAIKWEPLLHMASIGVSADNGIVTISGTVDSFLKKTEALQATQNVAGVKVVVDKIDIQLSDALGKTDADIAAEIVRALKFSWGLPVEAIKVEVASGWVTLEGNVKWNYQKLTVGNLVKNQSGVKGLINNIKLETNSAEDIEKKNIEDALGRSSSIDERHIVVSVSGNIVTLSGTVPSLPEKMEAERVTWNAPGVLHIENELIVSHNRVFAE